MEQLDRLGWRARERTEPAARPVVAAAGAALVVLGAVVLGVENLDGGSGFGGDTNRIPGTVLSLLLIGGGYGLLASGPERPRAPAGVVASVVGVPLLFFFLTVDSGDFPPFSIDATLIGSTLVWLASYLFAGRARGRPLYLGAALVGAWLFVLEAVESVFSSPFLLAGGVAEAFSEGIVEPELVEPDFGEPDFGQPDFGEPGGLGFDVPDLPDATTIGLLCLLFGVGYLVAMAVLDRRDYRGTATPFVAPALLALLAGVVTLAPDLEAVPTGLLLAAIGVGLATVGAASVRRFTTWTGAVAVWVGIATVAGDLTDDNATAFAVSVIVAGAAVVALAEWSAGAGSGLAGVRSSPSGPAAARPDYANGGSAQLVEPPPGPAGDDRG